MAGGAGWMRPGPHPFLLPACNLLWGRLSTGIEFVDGRIVREPGPKRLWALYMAPDAPEHLPARGVLCRLFPAPTMLDPAPPSRFPCLDYSGVLNNRHTPYTPEVL